MKKQHLTDLLGGTIEVERDDQIINLNVSGIQVPIIQRDYAQGRPEERIVLNRFLEAIFQALLDNRELELDFIYGSFKPLSKDDLAGVFLPLDGQQRLTTLYLLYWYLCNAELDQAAQESVREKLRKFSYATRSTASSFCEKLAEIQISHKAAHHIKQAYWFHKGYEKDPTVKAMLSTIEAIETRYSKFDAKLFHRLDRLCFYILPLDGFNLTDELYIKMNARGKQLTDFENFKADLLNRLKDKEHPDHEMLFAPTPYGESVMPYYLTIASRIDNSWTDIFWPSACQKEKDEEKIVDPFFLRFINRYVLNLNIIQSERPVAEIEHGQAIGKLYGQQGNDVPLRYRQFELYEPLANIRQIGLMAQMFDNFNAYQGEIRALIQPVWESKDNNWFLFDEKINQTQRILFLAVCLYLERNPFNPERFKEWIRVSWNIIIDPDIRSIPAMITAMKTIYRLAEGSADIYVFLQSDKFQTSISENNNIHRDQLMEESQKAALLVDNDWAVQIYLAESHGLFQGNIGFLLTDSPDLNQFTQRLKHAQLLLNASGSNKNFSADFGLFRYVISTFSDWKTIEQFTYGDDTRNWQLSLRRHASCKRAVMTLCDSNDANAMLQTISTCITVSSGVSGWDNNKIRRIHESLYRYSDFTHWTQKQDRLTKIKWLFDHTYLIRPSAWYDKVMIDCYRNELITSFCLAANITPNNRCGQSNFYHGEDIEFTLNKNAVNYKIIFNRDNKVIIRTSVETENGMTWQNQQIFNGSDVIDDLSAQTKAEEIFGFIVNPEPVTDN
jgi:hypothetical protein